MSIVFRLEVRETRKLPSPQKKWPLVEARTGELWGSVAPELLADCQAASTSPERKWQLSGFCPLHTAFESV